MTIEANRPGRFPKLRVIFCAVRIVAIETSHPSAIHHALNEIITLHPILMRGAIGIAAVAIYTFRFTRDRRMTIALKEIGQGQILAHLARRINVALVVFLLFSTS